MPRRRFDRRPIVTTPGESTTPGTHYRLIPAVDPPNDGNQYILAWDQTNRVAMWVVADPGALASGYGNNYGNDYGGPP
jgi:hypothetical protein